MDSSPIKLLHVEDNLAHRRLISHYLSNIKEMTFDVYHADSEEAAIDSFRTNNIQFVLLDYHLTQGDGLNCLRRIRQIDPLVPIVALSGVATSEIASELLEVGADDYLSKQELTRDGLAKSIRSVMSRVALMKESGGNDWSDPQYGLEEWLHRLCDSFLARMDRPMIQLLDDFEDVARQSKVTVWRLQQAYTKICDEMNTVRHEGQPPAEKCFRPLLLEILLRVFGQLPLNQG